MRLLKVLVPVVLIALLAACSQPLEPELDSGGVIVVTAGVAVESGAGPALRPQAQVQPGGVTLDGGGRSSACSSVWATRSRSSRITT